MYADARPFIYVCGRGAMAGCMNMLRAMPQTAVDSPDLPLHQSGFLPVISRRKARTASVTCSR